MRLLPQYEIVQTEGEAQRLLSRIMLQPEVSVDTETEGDKKADRLNRWKSTVNCWSVSFKDVACAGGANRIAIPYDLLFMFEPFFQAEHIDKIFHNAPFDLCMLHNSGIRNVKGRIICTAALDAVIDENRFGAHGLKECSWDYLQLIMRTFEDTFGKIPLNEFTIVEKADYATEDAWATLLLYWKLRDLAEGEELGEQHGETYSLWNMYEDHIIPFNRTITNMCIRGWRLDREYLSRLGPAIQNDIEQIDFVFNRYAAIHAAHQGIALHELEWERGVKHKRMRPVFPDGIINPGSNKQLAYFFVEVLGLPIIKMTEGGQSGVPDISMDDSVLKEYVKSHDCNFASLVLQRRSLNKSLGTYVRGLQKWMDTRNKIHASLRVMGARTGRLSCSDPNLQNIPRPDGDIYGLRSAFIADRGHVLIVADYSTLEMRIAASMSKCPDLIEAINSGLDLHCQTAANMFGIPYDDLYYAKENIHNMELSLAERLTLAPLVAQRGAAKAIGFGLTGTDSFGIVSL